MQAESHFFSAAMSQRAPLEGNTLRQMSPIDFLQLAGLVTAFYSPDSVPELVTRRKNQMRVVSELNSTTKFESLMKLVIFGRQGFIAGNLKRHFADAVTPDTDITDRASVVRVLDSIRPSVVINAAGKTGRPNVDWCEFNRIQTFRSNTLGPIILQEECIRRDIYFVHIGSGCIFDGDNNGNGFSEDDGPNYFCLLYTSPSPRD